ncbi:Tex-like N-terminal domain-containing protein [Mycoplasma sp. Mirounga ES2805-ORL]|uniref:Tex-like N-terminal domain-containing protein n=1 Tax=Mycoplasma sp. Mirounga ES2805-ORL TaxID=754514 RepID=UPI00197CA389|nr:Tex-like N-terminal domain-containing protein [Mycoplasma sp. Mirounga ES2805-ORL]QSF13411.1 helix-hairpin-helix domain-containing protein [Mycoplasma sp. Mirounga ES2805-ORL]
MDISKKFVSEKLQLKETQVDTVLELLSEGATVPFIARYRKNQTDGLDEDQIQKINEMYTYNVELNKRKEAIIEILKERKLLTPETEKKLNNAETKAEVENIYEPFKVGKKTKATDAIELGLEQLALDIFNATDENFSPFNEAKKYLNDKVETVEFAIEQSQFIISQIISQDVEVRDYVKNQIFNFGQVVTKIKPKAEDNNEIFRQYYDFHEQVKRIPNHRVLAISRGEKLKIISYDFTFNKSKIMYDLNNKFFKIKRTGKIIYDSLVDSLERLIYPSIIREIKKDLFEKAEKEAIVLFANNVETMLLYPAIKNKVVLAIDPGYINGCKIAVLGKQGELLVNSKIYLKTKDYRLLADQNDIAKKILNDLIDKYNVDIIVIGNGTASRESEELVSMVVKERKQKNASDQLVYAVVSEVGASVYSASKLAQEEFPDLDVQERSAINIGRRFQDPLNELIKIDPKSIGVGQYQHDVNQKDLSNALDFKIDKVVNLVGVDINTATSTILSYISGLNKNIASNIIEERSKLKKFTDRNQLKKVKGLGPKAFEQSIGFLRIHDSKKFYDRTSIHPESYKLADKIVEKLNIDLNDIDIETLKKADIKSLVKELDSNEFDVKLIIDSLINPTKDIRDSKDGYILKSDILKLDDLKIGMILDGSVQNITDFGAFVYIGLKQAALIHISNMKKNKDEIISHPTDILKTGDKIKIQIIGLDIDRGRIQGKLVF